VPEGKEIILDNRGRALEGWHCTHCEVKIPDEVANEYPSTISPIYKNVKCHKCKKLKVAKFWNQK
jgi:NAD-dependent SIR2 family protein deacetylase